MNPAGCRAEENALAVIGTGGPVKRGDIESRLANTNTWYNTLRTTRRIIRNIIVKYVAQSYSTSYDTRICFPPNVVANLVLNPAARHEGTGSKRPDSRPVTRASAA
eukprot:2252185-Pyramimonas_sp.AAC.2